MLSRRNTPGGGITEVDEPKQNAARASPVDTAFSATETGDTETQRETIGETERR